MLSLSWLLSSTHTAIQLPFTKLANCNLGTFKLKLSQKKELISVCYLWQKQQASVLPCTMSVSASVTREMWCQGGVFCSCADYRVKATLVISIIAPVRKRHWLGGTHPKINDTTFAMWHLVFIIASRHGASHTNVHAHTLQKTRSMC